MYADRRVLGRLTIQVFGSQYAYINPTDAMPWGFGAEFGKKSLGAVNYE
jgi:hypothetical protein